MFSKRETLTDDEMLCIAKEFVPDPYKVNKDQHSITLYGHLKEDPESHVTRVKVTVRRYIDPYGYPRIHFKTF